ncbi:MAG: hypothetical protein JW800_05290 [Candidatus Omnitrophica bacterium]|nr:hypothetical protein [Candidatus Omnitrophota bacterium]
MTSIERIEKIFDFKKPDRVGIMDDFDESTVSRWKKEGAIPQESNPGDCLDLDIRLFGFDHSFIIGGKNIVSLERMEKPSTGEALADGYGKARDEEIFTALSLMEPFEHISSIMGKEDVLAMMASEASRAANLFADSLEFTLNTCQFLFDKGYRFDGAWIFGDLGYKDSLYFSTDYYNAFLFDLHKEMCDFFGQKGMPATLHSHGNVSDIVPHVIEAGFRAIEPLENGVGLDLAKLKKTYGRDLVLIGGVDVLSFEVFNTAVDEIKKKLQYLKGDGGYIYRADSPIFKDMDFGNYKSIIEIVKEYGQY